MKGKLAGALVILASIAVPAQAQDFSAAEKIRRLDIMLMVTSLRCRTGEDNFLSDFQGFEKTHLQELNLASAQLKRNLGPQADRALDKISTSIANQYGTGHPWLSCHDLKELAHELATTQGQPVLIAAADQAFAGDVQLARR